MDVSNAIALGAAMVALFSLWNTIQVEKRLTRDERLVSGPLTHPKLKDGDHSRSVLVVRLVNLGRRKALVHRVEVADRLRSQIAIDWSDEIDDLGNPIHQRALCLADPVADIFIRRMDGVRHTDKTVVHIWHSQAEDPLVLIFDSEQIF